MVIKAIRSDVFIGKGSKTITVDLYFILQQSSKINLLFWLCVSYRAPLIIPVDFMVELFKGFCVHNVYSIKGL